MRRALLPHAGAFAVLIFSWEATSRALALPALPPPEAAFWALAGDLHPELTGHLLASAARLAAGIGLSVAVAFPLGLWLGRSPIASRWAEPLVYLVHPVPKIVLLPIILTLFGTGDLSKVIVLFAILFFQVLVPVWDASRRLEEAWILAFDSLGGSGGQRLLHVVLPACLPHLFTALRLSLGTAVAVLFIAEAYATRRGIGYYVIDAWTRFDWPGMYAAILAMGGLGLSLYHLIGWLERLACPWLGGHTRQAP